MLHKEECATTLVCRYQKNPNFLVEKLKNKFVENKSPERAIGICKRNGSKFSPRGAVCFSSNQGKNLTLVKSQHTRLGILRLAEIRKSNGGEGTQPLRCVPFTRGRSRVAASIERLVAQMPSRPVV